MISAVNMDQFRCDNRQERSSRAGASGLISFVRAHVIVRLARLGIVGVGLRIRECDVEQHELFGPGQNRLPRCVKKRRYSREQPHGVTNQPSK